MFEIAGALGTPLALDEATNKRTFGHYARVLIEVDLTLELRERILVERKDFDFYVDVEFEKLPPFCNSCQIVGHSVFDYWINEFYYSLFINLHFLVLKQEVAGRSQQ